MNKWTIESNVNLSVQSHNRPYRCPIPDLSRHPVTHKREDYLEVDVNYEP